MTDGPGYAVERAGDEIVFLWQRERVGIGFDMLREERDGLHAEVHVKALSVKGWTEDAAHVHWARLNLSSTIARATLVKHLIARNTEIDWAAKLEIACERTRREWRRGEPVIDLATIEARPQLHLLERMTPMGETSVFFGDGASCKSMLSLAGGVAATTGVSIGPFVPTRQVPVMTLDWETTEDEQAERLDRICKGIGLANRPTFHYRALWRTLADEARIIRQDVARLGVGLVIVDSIAPACGGEVTAETAVPFFNALRSFGSGVTRLVVSHVSKSVATQEKGAGTPFGSIFVRNLARSAWEIQRADDDEGANTVVGMYHRKVNRGRKQPDVGVRVAFNDPSGPIDFDLCDLMDHAELADRTSIGDRIRHALRRGSLSTDDLAEAVGAKAESVARIARRLPGVEPVTRGAGGRGHATTWGLAAPPDLDQASGW